MPRTCYLCVFHSKQSKHLQLGKTTLHMFPRDPNTRMAWLKACGLCEEFDDVSKIKICSNHFTSDDYIQPNAKLTGRRLVLKNGAVPSISVPHSTPSLVGLFKQGSSVSELCNTFNQQVIVEPLAIVNATKKQKVSEPQSKIKTPDLATPTKVPRELCNTSNQQVVVEPIDIFTTPKKRRFSEPRFVAEIKTPDLATPRKARRVLSLVKQTDQRKNNLIKRLQDKNRYLSKRVASLKDFIKHLNEKALISEEAGNTLMNVLPNTMRDIVSRKLKRKGAYTPEIRSFALTLHFYSPKAYNYVRNHWKKLLPHPSTIRQWYTVVDGYPGFTKEAFDAMGLRSKTKTTIINLVIDEMSIKEAMVYHQDQLYGGVDCGTISDPQDNENIPMATNALVLMGVSLNDNWKIPIGYFLNRGLTGKERANILTQAFRLLNENNIKVYSITFDGAVTNLSMCTTLGANFDFGPEFKPYFKNPITLENCYVFLDLCHMAKLVRNTLGDKKILKTKDGDTIKWEYISKLYELQKNEGLRLANKLTAKHIDFANNRMSVRLAMQVLSESVYKSFCFLTEVPDSKLKNQFDGCQPTANFCLQFNNITDMLNCKNRFSKRQFDTPLTENNYDLLKGYADHFITYIKTLNDASGQNILKSSRKTGFIGLIVILTNMFPLFDILKGHGFSYLLTYKLSQDYLETFFSAIRSRGGFNNNPNAFQFITAYKRLLVRHEVKEVENGNCLFDGIEILHVASTRKKRMCPLGDFSVLNKITSDFGHDYINTFWQLNPYVENVVMYIAGYISKKLSKKIKCSICRQHLTGDDMPLLCKIKDRAAYYVAPSKDVSAICILSERILKQNSHCLMTKNIGEILIVQIFHKLGVPFNSMEMHNHTLSQDILDNHRVELSKLIIKFYINVRLFHEASKMSAKDQYIRQKYNKLVLFKGQ